MAARFGTTTREQGNWDLTLLPGRLKDVAKLAGTGSESIVWLDQVHSGDVKIVPAGVRGQFGRADALVTDQPGVVLTIRTADCVPVFLISDKAVGLAHAGMGGALKNVVPHTIDAMQRAYGVKPSDLRIVFGPHICGECYKMSDRNMEMFDQYPEMKSHLEKRKSSYYLSLADVLREQAEQAGVTQIEAEFKCTYEEPNLYSSRRGDGDNRLLSFITYARDSA